MEGSPVSEIAVSLANMAGLKQVTLPLFGLISAMYGATFIFSYGKDDFFLHFESDDESIAQLMEMLPNSLKPTTAERFYCNLPWTDTHCIKLTKNRVRYLVSQMSCLNPQITDFCFKTLLLCFSVFSMVTYIVNEATFRPSSFITELTNGNFWIFHKIKSLVLRRDSTNRGDECQQQEDGTVDNDQMSSSDDEPTIKDTNGEASSIQNEWYSAICDRGSDEKNELEETGLKPSKKFSEPSENVDSTLQLENNSTISGTPATSSKLGNPLAEDREASLCGLQQSNENWEQCGDGCAFPGQTKFPCKDSAENHSFGFFDESDQAGGDYRDDCDESGTFFGIEDLPYDDKFHFSEQEYICQTVA